jgi:hypothetical protein
MARLIRQRGITVANDTYVSRLIKAEPRTCELGFADAVYKTLMDVSNKDSPIGCGVKVGAIHIM